MLKVESFISDKNLGVTDGVEYLAEVSDGGRELIIIDNDFGNNSSVAYHEDGFLEDEEFQSKFKVR